MNSAKFSILNKPKEGRKMKIKLILFILFIAFSLQAQPKVLILEDGGTQDSVYAILNRTGLFNITMGGPYYTYTGANINQYNVIIFLNGVDWSYTMADSVQQKIVNRVAQGAGLFTIEWVTWNSTYPIIKNILPVTTNATYIENTTETLTRLANTHPIAATLPASFQLFGLHSFTLEALDPNPAKQAVTVFSGSWSVSAVTAGVWQSGKTTHWSSAGHYSSNNIWDNNTRTLLVNIIRFLANIPVGVNQNNQTAVDFSLSQNYPNPFNPVTTIHFSVPKKSNVSFKIYDAIGREVKALINQVYDKGSYQIQWNAENCASGVYYYRINAGEFYDMKKMTLIK